MTSKFASKEERSIFKGGLPMNFRILIPYVLENDADVDLDLCTYVNALPGNAVPPDLGFANRIVTDIDQLYFSQYSNTVLILANTEPTV
jgi:hypothetical protein